MDIGRSRRPIYGFYWPCSGKILREIARRAAVVLRFGVRLEHERRKTTDMWGPVVSEARRKRGARTRRRAAAVLTRPTRSGPGASAGEQAVGPSGCQGRKVNCFFSFVLSFLYLLVFKLFQIKFFKPIQNKTNISTPQNKINATT
jgi:hypothetical protein